MKYVNNFLIFCVFIQTTIYSDIELPNLNESIVVSTSHGIYKTLFAAIDSSNVVPSRDGDLFSVISSFDVNSVVITVELTFGIEKNSIELLGNNSINIYSNKNFQKIKYEYNLVELLKKIYDCNFFNISTDTITTKILLANDGSLADFFLERREMPSFLIHIQSNKVAHKVELVGFNEYIKKYSFIKDIEVFERCLETIEASLPEEGKTIIKKFKTIGDFRGQSTLVRKNSRNAQ